MAFVVKRTRLSEECRGDWSGCDDRCPAPGSSSNASKSNRVASHYGERLSRTGHLPALPTELVMLIFEYAARDSKSTAASLALVSRFARDTVLPLLFRSLVIQNRATVHLLTKFLATHTGIADHVRELWMRQSIDWDVSVIFSCSRLERLAITPTCFSALFRPDGIPSLRHLSQIRRPTPHELLLFPGFIRWADLVLGEGSDCVWSFLRGLTRLRLSLGSQLYQLLECRQAITGLSQLSHLASPVESDRKEVIPDVLNAFPKLRMFVMIPPYRDPWMVGRAFVRVNYAYPSPFSKIMCLEKPDERLFFSGTDEASAENSMFRSWRVLELSVWTTAVPISSLAHAKETKA